MLWPDGERTVLVPGDHVDIVGHYKLLAAIPNGRRYQAYDLLKSDSGFGLERFGRVWNDVFNFCATRTPATRQPQPYRSDKGQP